MVKLSFFSGEKLNREQRKKLNEELPDALLHGEHESLLRKHGITLSTRAYKKIRKVAEKLDKLKEEYGRKQAQSFIDFTAGKKKYPEHELLSLWPEYAEKIRKLLGVPKLDSLRVRAYYPLDAETPLSEELILKSIKSLGLASKSKHFFTEEITKELKKAELDQLSLDDREALLKKKLKRGAGPIKPLRDLTLDHLYWFGEFRDTELKKTLKDYFGFQRNQ
ncbi:hypothetical protein H0N96_01080 [Candidatus Micrarchaeota archaeon]|nr:hypothetical protein [Candidatus Micrarchaeota archaeon]